MQQEHNSSSFTFHYRWISTILLLALFSEWLMPWLAAGEWSNLIFPKTLLWITIVMLAVGLFRPKFFTFFVIGVCVALIALMLIFRHEHMSILQWLQYFAVHLVDNARSVVLYGLWMMSDELRTLLLFTGWLLLVPSVQAILWQYQMAFPVWFVTLGYLITLHIGFGFDIWFATIRVLVVGLLLLALTTWPSLLHKLFIDQKIGQHLRYHHMTMLILTLVIITAGVTASSTKIRASEPIGVLAWMNEQFAGSMRVWQQTQGRPLQHITSQYFKGNAAVQSGYSEDDSVLGHPLKLSDNTLFYGWSAIDHYWRGEALATYTGRGWIESEEQVMLHSITDNENEALAELEPGYREKGIVASQTITYVEPQQGLPLFHSGSNAVVTSLQASQPQRQLTNYIVEPNTGALFAPTKEAYISEYTILSEIPLRNIDKLRTLAQPNEQLAQQVWEEEQLAPYLQLPDSLPDRVVALSHEVAGGGLTNRYDQVKAIENYLQENYLYRLKSRVPDEGMDFVDHFLFEQQEGYCVHFATAMVIMLRSQDIPARYVKGYTMGEIVDKRNTDSGLIESKYEVSQKDAHAWVEVYFHGVGWIAFDPTPTSEDDDSGAAAWQSAIERLTNTWGAQLSQLGQQLAASNVWLLAGAGIAFISLMLIILRVKFIVRGLQRQLLLYRYAASYRKFVSTQLQLNNMLQIPLTRQKGKIRHRHKLTANQQRVFAQLVRSFMSLFELSLATIESDHGLKQPAHMTTKRQRVEKVRSYLQDKHKDALDALLTMYEQLNYGAQQHYAWPLPNRLQQLYKLLLNRKPIVKKYAAKRVSLVEQKGHEHAIE